jgi:metal-responsive CopG/Arc/MetJ family transcriptional regulator
METKQTPIRFPVELLNEINDYVGPRERSRFIIEAARKELIRLKQQKAIQNTKGVLKKVDYPEFGTSDDVSGWVRELREKSDNIRREAFDEE